MTTSPVVSITDELIAELEGEIRIARAINNRAPIHPDDLESLLAERADLKQQLAAASVDAERIEWLAEQFKTCTVYMDGQHPYYPNSIKLRTLRGPTFRMAIDAARNSSAD